MQKVKTLEAELYTKQTDMKLLEQDYEQHIQDYFKLEQEVEDRDKLLEWCQEQSEKQEQMILKQRKDNEEL